MNSWTCEVYITIDGQELLIKGRIENDRNYEDDACTPTQERVSVDRVWGCTPVVSTYPAAPGFSGGDEVELDYIPIDWWSTIRDAILDEAQYQIEYDNDF